MAEPEEMTKRYGRWMFYLFWMILCFFLYLYFSAWYEAQLYPNKALQTERSDSAVQVVLRRNRQYAYVAPGYINGLPVNFMVDTGATTVAVSDELAQRLQLKTGRAVRLETAAGRVTGYETLLEKIEIGPIVLMDVRATITPPLAEDLILLGMSALKQLHFQQKGNTLILQQDLPG